MPRVLKEDVDYHVVTNSGLPLHEVVDWTDPLCGYTFVVRVWCSDGKKLSGTVERIDNFCRAGIWVDLGKSSAIGRVLCSGKFHALETLICSDLDRHGHGSSSAVLCSSTSPLVAYGGGSFEEHSAMPWFSDEGEDSEVCQRYSWPDRYGWLPFVTVLLPGSSVSPTGPGSLGSSSNMVMGINFQWRRRITGRRGEDYSFVRSMDLIEILTLLKHRSTYNKNLRVVPQRNPIVTSSRWEEE